VSEPNILQKIDEIGAETRLGSFLFHVVTRGFFRTLFYKMFLLVCPKSSRYKMAPSMVGSWESEQRQYLVNLMVEDEETYPLINLHVMSTYTFILGPSMETQYLALEDMRTMLRKAVWRRGMENKDSPIFRELLDAFDAPLEEEPTPTP